MRLTPQEKLDRRYPLAKRMVEDGTASDQVRAAVNHLLSGKNVIEIAKAMGLSKSNTGELLKDPDGSQARARKEKVFSFCPDCGCKVFNSGSKPWPNQRCVPCLGRSKQAASRQWILDSVEEWSELYGAPPTAQDWNVAQARAVAHPERLQQILDRHADRQWPSVALVQKHFGSWNAAIEATGHSPVRPGVRRRPDLWHEHRWGLVAA